jgi:hypothetical protein
MYVFDHKREAFALMQLEVGKSALFTTVDRGEVVGGEEKKK